jgi:Ca-activated chloride channel homolog
MHLTAQLDLDVLAHETDDQLSVLVELTAPEPPATATRAPTTLVIVLDRSGSMTGERIESAKTALLTLVDRLNPNDRFGLVAFDTHAQVAVPTGPLTDKRAVKQAIVATQPGGGTDLSAGYFRGLQEAQRVAGPVGATVLLISDGHANAGLCDPQQLGDVARKSRADGMTTTTLGMGLGFDERLLSAIAGGGAGTEGFAESADDALEVIAGEVNGLLSLAAQAGSLLVRMSPYVRGVRILNELPSIAIVPEGLLAELGSFYSGESRKLVITFDVPGIPSFGLAQIASLEFAWIALPSIEKHTVTVPLHVNVVPGDEAAGRIPSPTVRTELAFQQAQKAKRKASTALSLGDANSARESLRRARTVLFDASTAAPPAMAAELMEELKIVSWLEQESLTGDVRRAAKLSSADAAFKSRTRGRRP